MRRMTTRQRHNDQDGGGTCGREKGAREIQEPKRRGYNLVTLKEKVQLSEASSKNRKRWTLETHTRLVEPYQNRQERLYINPLTSPRLQLREKTLKRITHKYGA